MPVFDHPSILPSSSRYMLPSHIFCCACFLYTKIPPRQLLCALESTGPEFWTLYADSAQESRTKMSVMRSEEAERATLRLREGGPRDFVGLGVAVAV